ncbi:MAG: alpha/beta hydrolase [Pirellula sp.]|jgi:phospholipase/carboxylesterase
MKFDAENWYLERRSFASLDSILIAPRGRVPDLLVTLCHGFGAPGSDLVSLAEELVPLLPEGDSKPAFLFPAAPLDMENSHGMPNARAWWLINMAKLAQLSAVDNFDALHNEIPPGIDEARTALEDCIEDCLSQKQWSSSKIVLGGFSQGAMLSVDTAIRSKRISPVALIAWSGALICESVWEQAYRTRPRSFAVFQSHGRQDMILPISTGRALQSFLKRLTLSVDYAEFSGPHTISTESLEGAARLLASALADLT